MSKFIIGTVSSCDLTAEFLKEHDIHLLCYPYAISGEDYYDDCDQEKQNAIYKRMRNGEYVDTSMINEYAYTEFFEKLMSQGKDVIFLDMTKKISASFVNAVKAGEAINEKYKDAPNRLYVMDTKCVSGGLGILVNEIRKMRDAGKTMDEAIEWAEANKIKSIHWFTVDDLKFLKRTGRVSNAAAMVGSLLSIKPVLYVDNEGHLMVQTKVRGRKKALLTILENMKKDFTNPDGAEVLINHADCMEDALFMKEKIMELFPTVAKIDIMNLSTIVGAHCGPGLFTIFYWGSERFK